MKHAIATLSPRPSPQTPTLLDQVQQHLDRGQPREALALLEASGQNGPPIRNAKGVCHLRMGQAAAALPIYRALLFPGGTFTTPDDTPTIFRANYVVTLLMMDNHLAAIGALYDIRERGHPAVRHLSSALGSWKRQLPLWRRLLLLVGAYPRSMPPLNGPPGWLQ